MKTISVLLFFFLTITASAQYQSLQAPKTRTAYANQLNDSVSYEFILPKIASLSAETKWPVYVVFDRQNKMGYSNTLHAIDYLFFNAAIPDGIVIGISLPSDERRYHWTSHEATEGKADAFLSFVLDELPKWENMDLDNRFLTLVGHSRTAMFATYALFKRPERIHAVFAASTWNLGSDGTPSKAQFLEALPKIEALKSRRYFHFSSGGEKSGEGHEKPILKLVETFKTSSLPSNLKWHFYHDENADHYTNYGLFVHQALSDIFVDYRTSLWDCFTLFSHSSDSIERIPWKEIDRIYEEKSALYGFVIHPDLTFYNSIASGLSGNFANVKQSKRNTLVKEVLVKGMQSYPGDDGLPAWYAEVLIEEGNTVDAKIYLEKALKNVKGNLLYTETEKREAEAYIREILQGL